MSFNPECPTCPIGDNQTLCFFASRLEKVYVSDGIAASPHENMMVAEDEIRQGQVTPDDISRLKPKIEKDLRALVYLTAKAATKDMHPQLVR